MSGGASAQTIKVSATTTAAAIGFDRAYSVLLRALSGNTDNINVNLGGVTATTGDLTMRPGETVSIDISPVLLGKLIQGIELVEQDFIRSISTKAVSGTQTLWVDVLRFNA